ncbi:MAG: ATP synthase F1 subunit delta, partial [Eubacterium sp.]|nr:ATP synthase F1 subunit delta [Eubacterium sp.]
MIHNIDKYLEALLSSNVSVSALEDALKIFNSSDELVQILDNPNVTQGEKCAVIDDLFAPSVRAFIAELAAEGSSAQLEKVLCAYINEIDKKNNIANATVYCTTPPNDEQLEGIKAFVCKEENAGEAKITIVNDDSLIGGFIIRVNSKEFDFSLKTKLEKIKTQVMKKARESSVDNESVISVLRQDIKDFEHKYDGEEIGTVIRVGDSIAAVHGLDHAMYGEIVVFDNGIKGMVQDIKKHQIGVILFAGDAGIHQGSKVKRTHKNAGVPVGSGFIGRIVNALGEPIDGKGDIAAEDYRPIEQPAPSIVQRKSVDTPLATGILSIDSMFPIGRGQRELIIGDRQTGKTSIALDTII